MNQVSNQRKRLILSLHKEHPRIPQKVINNHKHVPLPPTERTLAGPTVSICNSSPGRFVITWFTGGWEAATILPWRHGWQTKSFSNFNLGNPWIIPSELNLVSRSKLKWPSLLCHFQSSEEDPATKHWEEPKESEKSAQKLREMGKSDKQDSPENQELKTGLS